MGASQVGGKLVMLVTGLERATVEAPVKNLCMFCLKIMLNIIIVSLSILDTSSIDFKHNMHRFFAGALH